MKTFLTTLALATAIASSALAQSAPVVLSPGEIAWGTAMNDCLAKEKTLTCYVTPKDDGHLTGFCTHSSDKATALIATCSKEANASLHKKAWAAPKTAAK